MNGDRVVILASPRDRDWWASVEPFGGWATISCPPDEDPWSKSIPVHFDNIHVNNTYRFPPEYVFPLYVVQEEPDDLG